MVEWVDSFICSICNKSRKVVKDLGQGTDPDTKNPYQKMELECGHMEKRLRITKPTTLRWQIDKGEKVEFEPVYADGTPALSVASGGHTTTIVRGSNVNLNFEGGKNNTYYMNITNTQSEGNNNFIQNLSKTEVNITYNDILKQIDRDIPDESERKEIKDLVEKIKKAPDLGLLEKLSQKLKRHENLCNTLLPVILKGIDFVKFFNS